MKKLVLITVLCLAMTAGAYEGYAPIATGGAGGTVVNVTNLNDSGTGSLRAVVTGLTGSTPTIIRFTVGGSICVGSEIRLTAENVTIDGSTAPSPGITLVGSGAYAIFGVNIDDANGNLIVSHIRFRNSGLEDFQIWGGGKMVIDHCSFTGSLDGALDLNSANHIVISRCLFGGCMEVHKAHGTYISAHHNLYSWNNRRQPRVFGGGPYWDFRNNVIEYWTNSGTNILLSDAVNVVNNWYGDPAPTENCNLGFWSINATNVYTAGNYSNCGQNIDAMGNRGTPNTEPGVTTTSAAVAYSSVLADVGAQPTDAIDQYYIDGGGTNPPGVGSCGGGSSSGGGGGGEGSYLSDDTKDGYVRESTETSGVGDYVKTTNSYIGDTTSKQQYVVILSFDTSGIPDSATITSATLTIRRLGQKGSPSSTLGALTADIKTGTYGTLTLQTADFQTASDHTNVVTMPYPAGNGDYSTGSLNSDGRAHVNKTGYTQMKLHFATDDDNDATADYLDLYDSNYKPTLEVIWSD